MECVIGWICGLALSEKKKTDLELLGNRSTGVGDWKEQIGVALAGSNVYYRWAPMAIGI